MGDIAVREDNLVNLLLLDQFGELILRVNGDSLRIKISSKFRGINSALNIGDLSRCESDDIIVRIVPEINVEVVKIASCSAHDNHTIKTHDIKSALLF
jgi:hypothetical protein